MIRSVRALFLGCALVALGSSAAAANGSDDDDKNTVESRLLKILRDRGVLKQSEFEELSQLAARMRAEDSTTSIALEREIKELEAKLANQAAAKPAGPTGSISYSPGKGMALKYGEDFELRLTFYIQPRFLYINPGAPTSTGNDDRASFEVKRAEMAFEGYAFGKDTTYKVSFDVAQAKQIDNATPTVSNGILRDCYIDHMFDPALHVRFGQMKRPFLRQAWISSSRLEFVDRSEVSDRFRSVNGGDRGDGVMLWGELFDNKEFEWYAMVDNGEPLNNGTPNNDNIGGGGGSFLPTNSANDDSSGLEVVARIAYNPMGPFGYAEADLDRTEEPKLAIGFQYMYTPERRGNPLGIAFPAGTLPIYYTQTLGPDIAFKYMGFFFQAEYYWRQIQPAGGTVGGFQTASEDGWYAQAGYFFGSDEKQRGFEAAIRFATIDFDQSIAPAVTPGNDTQDNDYTACASYYFYGHNLKLQTDFTYRVQERTARINYHDQILRIGAQLNF